MRHLSSIALAILLCAFQTFGQYPRPDGHFVAVDLTDVLSLMGNYYDCYFTIETGLKSDGNSISLENIHLPKGTELGTVFKERSLTEALQWLNETVPFLDYKKASYNSQVVHIMDKRVTQGKDYPLEQTIESIKFDGYLFDLINEIRRNRLAVSPKHFGDTRELSESDYSTKVHLHENNKKVRDILTQVLHLENRGRILWIAETELVADNITYVRYLS